MAGSEVFITVKGDAKQFTAMMDTVDTRADKTADKMSAAGGRLTRGLTLPILGAGAAAITMAADQEEAEAKITSTFESMGAASWTTVEALKATASEFQNVSTFGDEAILGLQDVLLTFGDIQNVVGDGNDIFDQATQAGLNLSAALGGDLQGSAIMIGKALNEPLTGMAALTRVGVVFTEQQQDMIKGMVESGDSLGAQKVLLEALESQFGGTAQAVADTSQGQLKQSMNALGDSAEAFGAILLPVVVMLADGLKKLSAVFSGMSPEAKKVVVVVLGLAATIGPLLIVGAKMVKMWGAIKVAFGVLSKAMSFNPWVLLAIAVVAIAVLIYKNWDTIVAFLLRVWKVIKDAASATWEWIQSAFQNVIDFLTDAFFNFTPLGLLIKHWDDLKAAASATWEWVKAAFQNVIGFLTDAFFNFTPLGLLIKHWDDVKTAASATWQFVKEQFDKIIGFFVDTFFNFTPLGLLIQHWDDVVDAAVETWEGIKEQFDKVIGFFEDMPGEILRVSAGMWNGIANAFVAMLNFLIERWNNLSFGFDSFTLPTVLGGHTMPAWEISTPQIPEIPEMHRGGVFNSGRGQGLAILQDGETVIPRGGDTGNLTINVTGFVGSEFDLAEAIDKVLTRRQKRVSLGFTA
jgi:hypothetical protein